MKYFKASQLGAVAIPWEIFAIGFAMIGLMLLGFLVLRWLRRRAHEPFDDLPPGGMTIEQVEQMHERGLISDEEFSAMRRIILGLKGPEEKGSFSPGNDDIIKDQSTLRGDDLTRDD
jgi:hypothetical protein